jgi:hypothetical protein
MAYDTEPRTVTTGDVETILNEVVVSIRSGAGSAVTFDDDAITLFKRRYRGSFQYRLDHNGDWEKEKGPVLNVAKDHGMIAAAIARLNHTDVIDDVILMKAAHIVEIECHNGARAVARARAGTGLHLAFFGQWCW